MEYVGITESFGVFTTKQAEDVKRKVAKSQGTQRRAGTKEKEGKENEAELRPGGVPGAAGACSVPVVIGRGERSSEMDMAKTFCFGLKMRRRRAHNVSARFAGVKGNPSLDGGLFTHAPEASQALKEYAGRLGSGQERSSRASR